MHESSEEFEFLPDPITDCGVSALDHLKKSPWTYNGKNGVATFSRLFLIGSISYLQVTITYVRAWMSLKFGQIRLLVSMATYGVIMEKTVLQLFFCQIRLLTVELAALECLQNPHRLIIGKTVLPRLLSYA